jgi:nucleoporin GLE1
VQLLREMELLRIHETELNKVAAYQQRAFYEDLNRRSAEQAERDFVALAAVQARRETLRQEAEAVLQAHLREEEEKAQRRREERARREEEEAARKAAEEQARREAEEKARREREETAARERAAKEDAARKEEEQEEEAARQQEAARKAAEEKAAKDAADAAAAKKAADDEAARAEAVKRAEAAAVTRSQPSTSNRPSTASPVSGALHSRYLTIHARLKTFRADFWNTVKKGDPKFKSEVGDMRRLLRTSVGQLVEGKGTNKQPTENVRKTFLKALTLPSPPVDIRDFLAKPPPTTDPNDPFQVPSLMIYIATIFSKAIIAQFTGEAAVNTKSAEPAGVLAVQIFSTDEFSFHGTSLIDILLAKLHASCPVLWGIYGPESTALGKKRLGWRIENGAFVSEQRHSERMTGLGAGFAAISLRNFSKTKLKNPFPPREYWESVANIVNVPPEEVQLTHLMVLRSMLENAVDRFILFFDGAAVAALRHALVEFPRALPAALGASPACKALEMLVEQIKTEKNLSLI